MALRKKTKHNQMVWELLFLLLFVNEMKNVNESGAVMVITSRINQLRSSGRREVSHFDVTHSLSDSILRIILTSISRN